MTDPTFTTRADMLAWAGKWAHKQTLRFARGRDRSARSIGNKLRRVTAAHSHLIEGEAQ